MNTTTYLRNVNNFMVHPAHHEAIIRHAVRNIPGATKLLNDVVNLNKYVPVRPRDDHQSYDDSLKDHLT